MTITIPTLDSILAKAQSAEQTAHFIQCDQLAEKLYGDQRSISGMQKLDHGRCVANLLLDLHLDLDTIRAGWLNHVTPDQLREVTNVISPQVSAMIAALRKLDIYTDRAPNANQHTLEAIRRAALSLIEGDVRVVMVRLTMALVTLQASADFASEAQRRLIAQDVQNIYAPLANRLGMWQFKWQLEDLSFSYLEPEEYERIVHALDENREERDKRIEGIKATMRQKLEEQGIVAEVTGRSKHIYSIYRKMKRKKVGVSELFDTHAIRVIIEKDEPEDDGVSESERRKRRYTYCYKTLGIAHSIWEAIPSEFDDYIQHPKPNGYRSLHTAVYDDSHHHLEVQIRTRKMHEEAEQGFAAHWAYKEGGRPSAGMLRQIESLRNLLEAMVDPSKSAEPQTEEVIIDSVYVFTPKGDVIDLPRGATPLDFAYAVHTEVGHRCRGAKVNGRMVPLSYALRSGDRIEILTTSKEKPGKPSRDWMNTSLGYTTTTRAQSRIRRWFRENEREQNIEFGRSYVERELRSLGLNNLVTIEELTRQAGEPDVEEFLAKVGFGDITVNQINGAAQLIQRDKKSAEPPPARPLPPVRPTSHSKKGQVIVLGMAGLHTHIANCCTPIPPEPILGYVTRGRGVAIHRHDCTQIIAKEKKEPERIVEASWNVVETSKEGYPIPFRLKAYNGASLLDRIATILQGQNIPLLKTKKTELRHNQTQIYLQVQVKGLEQANWVQEKLRNLPDVFEVVSR